MWSSYYGLLSAYLQVSIKYQNPDCALIHLHIYTRDMLKVWHLHVSRLHLIGYLSGLLCICLICTVHICFGSSKLTIITYCSDLTF